MMTGGIALGILLYSALALYLLYTFDWRPAAVVEFMKGNKGPRSGVMIVCLVIFTVCLLAHFIESNKAHAGEPLNLEWAPEVSFYAGLDTPIHQEKVSPQCYRGGTDDKVASFIGVDFVVARMFRNVELTLFYNHQSCALNEDARVEDTVGLMGRYTFDLKSWRN